MTQCCMEIKCIKLNIIVITQYHTYSIPLKILYSCLLAFANFKKPALILLKHAGEKVY